MTFSAPAKGNFARKTPQAASSGRKISSIKFGKPQAGRREENGWQMRCKDLKARIAALFNHDVMSDVQFVLENVTIHAHRFVLSTASPVFYKQLFEQANSEMLGGNAALLTPGGYNAMTSARTVIQITDVPHDAFHEFLKFIYTDAADISLENVLDIIVLADTYRVPGISDLCTDFLHRTVSAASALKIIQICRKLEYKAILGQWFQAVCASKAEKQVQMPQLGPRRQSSTRASMVQSRQSTVSGGISLPTSPRDDLESVVSASDIGEREMSIQGTTVASEALADESGFDIKKIRFSGKMLDCKIGDLVEQLRLKCWSCVAKDTEVTINSDYFLQQDVETLKALLKLETVSCTEIILYRAVMEWAARQCKLGGLAANGRSKRQVLGMDVIMLLRFPAMTPDQFQWEVVPSGLLTYEEAQSVLVSAEESERLDKEKFMADDEAEMEAGRFVRRPRTYRGASLLTNRQLEVLAQESTVTAVSQAGTAAYATTPGDHLDNMLGASLLGVHLKQSIEDQLANDGAVQEGRAAEKLPPISSPSSPSGESKRKKRDMMVMGSSAPRTTEAAKTSSSRPVSADDFVRLAHGIYSFRGERLLEIWAQHGEAMVCDHGVKANLDEVERFLEEYTATEKEGRLRQILGLAEGPPFGRGVPLSSFLVKQ